MKCLEIPSLGMVGGPRKAAPPVLTAGPGAWSRRLCGTLCQHLQRVRLRGQRARSLDVPSDHGSLPHLGRDPCVRRKMLSFL